MSVTLAVVLIWLALMLFTVALLYQGWKRAEAEERAREREDQRFMELLAQVRAELHRGVDPQPFPRFDQRQRVTPHRLTS